jgi:sulfate adenylyltransferase subunit 1
VRRVAGDLGLADAVSVPVSALRGDNVVERSGHTPWYSGPTLMELLESLPSADDQDDSAASFRFPVQLVVRPQGALAPGVDPAAFRDYRAYAGQIAAGTVRRGDTVSLLTPGQPARTTTVVGIDAAGQDFEEAVAPQSVSLRLAEEFDVARGDLIAAVATAPTPSADLSAEVCWLAQQPLRSGAGVLVKHGTATVRALVQEVEGRLDLDSLRPEPAQTLELNDIGRVRLKLSSPLPVEPYARHRRTGAFLVIDPQDGNTLAAGMVQNGAGA